MEVEVVLAGLCVKDSSSLTVLTESTLGAMEGLERTVASEEREPLSEGFTDSAELEALESREGGRGFSAEKAGARGDCRRDEGRESTAGELAVTRDGLRASLGALAGDLCFFQASSGASCGGSLVLLAPTEALRRL